jgi:phage terminase large subunit GpA-like protein
VLSIETAFSPDELRALRPIEQCLPSAWAQQNRVLTRRQSSRPGPWQNENAPPLKGLMDLCVRKTIREIWLVKAAQIGASEAIRNVLGHRAQREPDPALIVLPDEKVGRKIVGKRLLPLFEDTDCLKELMTGSRRDAKLTSILLINGFELGLAWAGSAASLASDPIRLAVLDEVDKFPEFTGREAAPVDLARVRLRTYTELHLSLLIALSTPTTRNGPITKGFEACSIKLWYFVPCPHCRTNQRLIFDRLKWEKFKEQPTDEARANLIRMRKAAWYQCAKCNGRIEEHHKKAALLAGYWGTLDGKWKLFFDGHEEGAFPEGDRVGVHLSALYDLSTSFAAIAAEAVEAGKNPEKLMHLRNSTLAEVFEQPVATPTVNLFASKCRPDPESDFVPPKAKLVPKWASRLLMTVDTQKDHFWFVIRAFGYRYRSQRIHHGKVQSFEDLKQLFDNAYFPYQDDAYPPIRCHMAGIDSGGTKVDVDRSRTDEVYQFCLTDPIRLKPLKGASKPSDQPIRLRKVIYSPANKARNPYEVWLFLIDPGYYQDLLAHYSTLTIPLVDEKTGELLGDEDFWQLNDVDDGEYNAHLANMHKVRLDARGFEERWVPKTEGARVDLRDCEVYQLAMAHGPANCGTLPSPQQMAEQLEAQRQAQLRPPVGLRTPDGRPFIATQRKV